MMGMEKGLFEGISKEIQTKIHVLKDFLYGKKVIVAFSGGIDSAILLWFSKEFADEVLAVMIDTPYMIKREIKRAQEIASDLDVPFQIVHLDIDGIPDIINNPPNRCYYCKKNILTNLTQLKTLREYDLVVEGSQMDDLGEDRPGHQAIAEFHLKSPFVEAQLSKSDLYQISDFLQFPSIRYPANSCLATRVPHEIPLDPKLLNIIDQAESEIIEMIGIPTVDIRVRIHLLANHQYLARIEGDAQVALFLNDNQNKNRTLKHLIEIGFEKVSFDLKLR